MQAPNNKAAPFSFHWCVFYSSSVSLISQWILRIQTFISSHVVMVVIGLGVLAENIETGEQWTSNSYRMLRFESFIFTCLTVHEFYGLKASQMSKVRASSHEYVENQESSGTEF